MISVGDRSSENVMKRSLWLPFCLALAYDAMKSGCKFKDLYAALDLSHFSFFIHHYLFLEHKQEK